MNRRNEAEQAAASTDQLGVARIQEIQWAHPRLLRLTDAARLVYACLVDGCSSTARERYTDATEMREALDEICLAVEELISAGLLILLDRGSIFGGWVMKPWQNRPS